MNYFRNKTKLLAVVLVAAAVVSGSAFYLVAKTPAVLLVQTATPTVGTPTASPNTITAVTPTTVTVTVQITDPNVIANGVNLLRLNPTGNPIVLGVMHDDGLNGDTVANDKNFTLAVSFNEASPGQIQLQVSAAFRGQVRRVLSPTLVINVIAAFGMPTATPDTVKVNTPTRVTFAVRIEDQSLPMPMGSVSLVKVQSNGTKTTIGLMHDDGNAGDVVAGDSIFTAVVILDERYPGPLIFQVSALAKSTQVSSAQVTIKAQGLVLQDNLTTTTRAIQGTIVALKSYSSNSLVFTDLNLTVTRTIKGIPLPNSIIVSILGGPMGGESWQSLFAPFTVGQEVVMLVNGPNADNKYSIQSGPLGVFRLKQSGSDKKIAVVDPGINRMEINDPLDPSYTTFLDESSQGKLSLDALIAALLNP